MTPTQLTGVVVLLVIALVICYLIYRWAKRSAAKKLLEREDSSSTIEFKTLESFMQFLPKYCLRDDVVSKMTREALKSVGVKYQKRVFIDTEGGDDKELFMRKGKYNTFVHEKGRYLDPRFYSKDIVYHFMNDARPIVDMANDKAWYNSDMCSRFLYSVTNTEDMKPKIDQNLLLMIIGGLALGILLAIVVSYSGMKQEQQHYEAVWNYLNVINQTRGH